MMSLTACVTGGSRAYVCPPIQTYPKAFQDRLAAELQAAPKGAAWAKAIIDYSKHRQACRLISGDDP
jgi:hypothetical protein